MGVGRGRGKQGGQGEGRGRTCTPWILKISAKKVVS